MPSPSQVISPGPQMNIWKGGGIRLTVKRGIMRYRGVFLLLGPREGQAPIPASLDWTPPFCSPQASAALRALVFPQRTGGEAGGSWQGHSPRAQIGPTPAGRPAPAAPSEQARQCRPQPQGGARKPPETPEPSPIQATALYLSPAALSLCPRPHRALVHGGARPVDRGLRRRRGRRSGRGDILVEGA